MDLLQYGMRRRGGTPAQPASASVWPDEAQEWLIEAGLGDPVAAAAAWERWWRGRDLQSIDAASQRLLPLVARNLPLAAESPIVKGVYRKSWVRNQLLFAAVGGVVAELERAGIRTLVLKGVALSVLHYADAGARPMDDADVLVRPDDMARAVAVLRGLGWQPRGEPRSWPPRHQPGWPLIGPAGTEIDLHGYALAGDRRRDVDRAFWERAVPIQVGRARTLALSPADQLFHVIAHGLRWNAAPPIRWAADALVILRSAGSRVDWAELRATAAARRRTRTLHAALAYLRARFGAAVPPEVEAALREFRVSPSERLEHYFAVRDHAGALGTLPNLWFAYRASAEADANGFPGYLLDVWSLDGRGALARVLARKAARRIWHRVRRWHSATIAGGAS